MSIPDRRPSTAHIGYRGAMSDAHVSDLVEIIEDLWPLRLAESWDVNGLSVGEPHAVVRRILVAVDPMDAVIDEAEALHADMLVTHHPLLLRPVNTVASSTLKGGAITRLIRSGIAHYNAHTNADSALGGVSDALIDLFDVSEVEPLVPVGTDLPGVGLGRVGILDHPTSVRQIARTLADSLPATVTGVRVAGDPQAPVHRLAVLAGAGDSLFDEVRAHGADCYVTSDLRHHPATEARDTAHRTDGTPHLVDVSHWAAESLWLDRARTAITAACTANGWDHVEVVLSRERTDPWTERIDQEPRTR